MYFLYKLYILFVTVKAYSLLLGFPSCFFNMACPIYERTGEAFSKFVRHSVDYSVLSTPDSKSQNEVME